MAWKWKVVNSMSWPSGSLIMMADPSMSVSSRISPPFGTTFSNVGGNVGDRNGQMSETWVVHNPPAELDGCQRQRNG